MILGAFILGLLSPHVSAQDKTIIYRTEKGAKKIAPRLFSGSFLIYDCLGRHFACVNEDGFALCKNRRNKDLDRRSYYLPCAPFKNYETTDKCVEQIYSLVHRMINKQFCLNFDGPLGD